jgi:hypothetical protein
MPWNTSLIRVLLSLSLLGCLPLSRAAAANDALMILQTSPLAGFQHHAGATLFALMQVGDHLELRREPSNPFDAKAVRVDWNGAQIGYAPRADNVDLARLMDRGTRIEGRILHLQKSRDPWKRVLMELYVIQPDDR